MVAPYVLNCTRALASALLIGAYGGLMLSLLERQTEVAHAKREHVSRIPLQSVEAMLALLQERLLRRTLPQHVWAPAEVLLRSSAIGLRRCGQPLSKC